MIFIYKFKYSKRGQWCNCFIIVPTQNSKVIYSIYINKATDLDLQASETPLDFDSDCSYKTMLEQSENTLKL